jgi:hypothetical protein
MRYRKAGRLPNSLVKVSTGPSVISLAFDNKNDRAEGRWKSTPPRALPREERVPKGKKP